jgi:soluble lytic murein transglycosylase-like protein
MRAVLVLAMLLLALEAATPASKYQDSVPTAGAAPAASSPDDDRPSIAKADRELVLTVAAIDDADGELALAIPVAVTHGGDVAPPPQSVAPATANTELHGAAAPSLDDLCADLLTSAENNDLPVPFFANLIWQESRLRQDAVSRVGALGIAQFMPQVAVEVGLDHPFDPHQAIPASARFLHTLRQRFGNLGFVAAAYNAGARRVSEWLVNRRRLPRETRIYVARVTGRSVDAWRKAPPDDSALTFVRLLPCRELPAFQDLEQARFAEARQLQQAQAQQQQAVRKMPSGPSRAARVQHRPGAVRRRS